MNNNKTQPDLVLNQLEAELFRVAQILREQVGTEPADSLLTAIVRLVPGLGLPKPHGTRQDQADAWLDHWHNYAYSLPDANGRDKLTGMWQSQAFIRELDQILGQTRQHGMSVSLILFELDQAKPADNPAYSLTVRALCCWLWESVSDLDLPGRLDANLFALALPGCSPFQAKAMAENVLIRTEEVLQRMRIELPVLRAGISSLARTQTGTAHDLLDKARQVLNLAVCEANADLRQRIILEKGGAVKQSLDTLVLADEKQFLFTGGIQ